MHPRRALLRWILPLLVLAGGAAAAAGADPGELQIETRDGARYRYRVEIADSDEARRTGLMYRQSLDTDAGMLFLYPQPRRVNIWMKNTWIPLDILFLSASGEVLQVAAMAQPHSTTLIPSPAPVLAVLEINGGQAQARGIRAGDRVLHPAFAAGP